MCMFPFSISDIVCVARGGTYWSAIRFPPIASQVHDDRERWLAVELGVVDPV
jgi:hypothetical protein